MTVRVRQYRKRGVIFPGRWEAYLVVKRSNGDVFKEKLVIPDLSPGRATSRTTALLWAQQRYAVLMSQGRTEDQAEGEKRAPTLSEFAPRFIEWAVTERQKPSEIESKQSIIRKHLVPTMGSVPLDELSTSHLQALKARLKNRSQKTVNNVLAVLSKLLKVALELEAIAVLPITVKGKKTESPEMQFYEFEDYARLVQAAESISNGHLLMMLLGGDSGLRRGEIIALDRHHVDLMRGVMTIRQSEWRENLTATKGGKSRKVPMTAKLKATVEVALKAKGKRVLCREDGSPMTAETLKWWMEQVQEKAGMEINGKLHVLRHTFCSHLAMKGANAVTIQSLAGHKDLTTTGRYMHLGANHQATAIALLDQRTAAAVRSDEAPEKGSERPKVVRFTPGRGANVAPATRASQA